MNDRIYLTVDGLMREMQEIADRCHLHHGER